MRAYKFLDASGCAPFTGTPWAVGVWVEASTAVPCREGVHACRAGDVATWIAATMWHIELDGEIVEAHRKVVASRGRLIAPVEGYDDAMRELREIGAWRSRDLAVRALRDVGTSDLADHLASATSLDALASLGAECDDRTFGGRAAALAADAAHFAVNGLHAQTPFVAACAAGPAASGPDGDQNRFDVAYQAERDFQSRWLAGRLALA